MIRIMCAIRDVAAEIYLQPFFVRHTNEALRDFKATVNTPNANNVIATAPADFELWQLAEFDDETGGIHNTGMQRIARATDLKDTLQ